MTAFPHHFIALTVSAWLVIPAAASELQIKDLRIGMTEQELKKAYPRAKCTTFKVKVDQEKTLPVRRDCALSKFTIANKEMNRASFSFLDDKLSAMSFGAWDFHYDALREALASKFGKPVPHIGAAFGVTWPRTDGDILLLKSSEVLVLKVNSNHWGKWLLDVDGLEKKQNRADI